MSTLIITFATTDLVSGTSQATLERLIENLTESGVRMHHHGEVLWQSGIGRLSDEQTRRVLCSWKAGIAAHLQCGSSLDGVRALLDEVCGVEADDVDGDHLIRVLTEDDLISQCGANE